MIGTRLQQDREERDAFYGVLPCEEEHLEHEHLAVLLLVGGLTVTEDIKMCQQRNASHGVEHFVSQP